MTDTMEAVRRAEARHEESVLLHYCQQVGAGLRTLQSRQRTADIARRRAVLAWALAEAEGWTQARIARALCRTTRQIKTLVKKR